MYCSRQHNTFITLIRETGMSWNHLLALLTATGMLLSSVVLYGQSTCPTDDNDACPWKERYLAREKFVQYDTVFSPTHPNRNVVVNITKCERYFTFNVCYRCCDGKLEVRLSTVQGCDENGNPDPDVTRGCKWRYDTQFWKQVDGAIAYRFKYLDCNTDPLNCDNLPDCKDGRRQVVSYYKANCWRYEVTVEGMPGWKLVPCQGSGDCKQVYELCCKNGMTYTYNKIESTSYGGCIGSTGGETLDECYQSCWE